MICRCPLRTLARWMWIKYCGRILPWTVWLRPIPMDWKRRMEFLEAKRLAFLRPYSGPTVIWNSAKIFFLFRFSGPLIDWLIGWLQCIRSFKRYWSIDWLIGWLQCIGFFKLYWSIDWLIGWLQCLGFFKLYWGRRCFVFGLHSTVVFAV